MATPWNLRNQDSFRLITLSVYFHTCEPISLSLQVMWGSMGVSIIFQTWSYEAHGFAGKLYLFELLRV